MTETTATPVVTATPAFDKTLDAKEFNFRFKKDKMDNQRATVKVTAGVPSVEGIVAILEKGGKGLELLQDAIADVVRSAIAVDVGDDEKYSQSSYNTAVLKLKNADGTEYEVPKYSWEGIANQPRADRRASNITQENWEAFAADYIAIMPGITGKDISAVTNATVVFLKKFSIIKTDKPVLSKLKDQLALYVEHTKKGEEFQEILELLTSKVDGYLAANDVELLIQNL